MLVHKVMDTLDRIEKLAYGIVVVEGIDNVRNVLTHIYLNEPLALVKVGTAVNKVRIEHAGDSQGRPHKIDEAHLPEAEHGKAAQVLQADILALALIG